ncbi:MAG: hypothetical protein J5999_05720 [Oscillospiraceae bacterium]|nr:hypothetical protein [Oscillospiraceae bacterium]
MFKAKKILAGAAALAVALTCTGCSDTSWGAKAGDTEYRAGIYIYHAMNAFFDADSKKAETDTDVFASTIEDMPAKDWMAKETEKNLRNQAAIDAKFTEMGLELDEYSTTYADYMVEQMWSQYGDMFEGYGIGKESYRDVYLNSIKRDEIFMKYYNSEDGITPVSEDDIKAHLLDNYARVKYIALNLKDAEGNLLKSEGKAQVMKMAEDYLARAEGGESFDALIAEYDAYWSELTGADEETDDSSDNNEGGGQIIAIEDAEGNTITLFDEEDDVSEVTVPESPANEDSPEEETSVNEDTEETTVPETEAEEDETDDSTDEPAETEAPESETEPVSSDNTETTVSETEPSEDVSADAEEEDAAAVNNEKVIKKGDYSPSKNVNEAIFNTMKDGEYKIIEDGEYYYLVYRMELFSDETYYDTNKNAALYEMKEEEFSAMVDSWAEAVSLTINEAAVKRYKFEKFAEE